jgi:hypothetical protein
VAGAWRPRGLFRCVGGGVRALASGLSVCWDVGSFASPFWFVLLAAVGLSIHVPRLVTPPLRGVAIRLTKPLIEARFIYEHEPTEDEVQIVAEVETYVIADFRPPTNVIFKAVGAAPPAPRELVAGEEWVYLRREAGEEL